MTFSTQFYVLFFTHENTHSLYLFLRKKCRLDEKTYDKDLTRLVKTSCNYCTGSGGQFNVKKLKVKLVKRDNNGVDLQKINI
jgi:hypothetical protein